MGKTAVVRVEIGRQEMRAWPAGQWACLSIIAPGHWLASPVPRTNQNAIFGSSGVKSSGFVIGPTAQLCSQSERKEHEVATINFVTTVTSLLVQFFVQDRNLGSLGGAQGIIRNQRRSPVTHLLVYFRHQDDLLAGGPCAQGAGPLRGVLGNHDDR